MLCLLNGIGTMLSTVTVTSTTMTCKSTTSMTFLLSVTLRINKKIHFRVTFAQGHIVHNHPIK